MDFFYSLDDVKYAELKQNVKNGWAMKSMQPPKTVNEIYRLAGVWVKPTARSETGTAATYHTGGAKLENPQKNDEEDKKPKKDLSKVKCYGCGKKGHIKTYLCARRTSQRQGKKRRKRKAAKTLL
jgi:hypothetical protein